MYRVFSILNLLRVHHQVLMASWLAAFIVYQNVRQHFSSATTNFHHFSNIKIFASFVFFRTSVSFSFFFFKFYSSSLSTVQWKFYFHFHFLYWFSLKFIWVFALYFSEQLKKEIGKFYDFLKKYISRLIFSSFLDIYLLHTAVFPLHSCEFQIIFSIFFDFLNSSHIVS